jgi:hypothetical protein
MVAAELKDPAIAITQLGYVRRSRRLAKVEQLGMRWFVHQQQGFIGLNFAADFFETRLNEQPVRNLRQGSGRQPTSGRLRAGCDHEVNPAFRHVVQDARTIGTAMDLSDRG